MEPTNKLDASLSEDGRYRLLVEAVTDYAIYMLDPNGIVTSWNPGAQRFKGYRRPRSSASISPGSTPTEDRGRDCRRGRCDTAAPKGKFESRRLACPQGRHPVLGHVVIDPIRTHGGDMVGYAKITRDLTERRQAERDAAAQRRAVPAAGAGRHRLRASTCSIPTATSPTGISGRSASRATRRRKSSASHFSQFYTEEDRASASRNARWTTAKREGQFEKEGWRVRKDGSRFWANVVIDPIRDDDGDLLGFAKITGTSPNAGSPAKTRQDPRSAIQAQKMEPSATDRRHRA